MTREEFIALFPLKGKLTKAIIEEADVYSSSICNGALTLKAALGEENMDKIKESGGRVKWGDKSGSYYLLPRDWETAVRIRTEENIDFMEVKKPRTVTFVINEL